MKMVIGEDGLDLVIFVGFCGTNSLISTIINFIIVIFSHLWSVVRARYGRLNTNHSSSTELLRLPNRISLSSSIEFGV